MPAAAAAAADREPEAACVGVGVPSSPAGLTVPTAAHAAQSWRHAVAGGAAGLASVAVSHPLDVVKTRLQVQVAGAGGRLPLYKGTLDALAAMWRTEGLRGFYAGLAPACLGSGAAYALYFYAYQALRGWAARENPGRPLSTGQNLGAAAAAGATVVVATNPIWVVKTRLQLQPQGPLAGGTGVDSGRYRGVGDALGRIAREEGVRGLYRGLAPALVMVSHGALQFAAYEEMKRHATAHEETKRRAAGGGAVGGRRLGTGDHLAMGGLAKLFASTATYPLQVLRSRLQQQDPPPGPGGLGRGVPAYRGLWDVAIRTWRHEGLGGFYRGVVPNVLRVMPASAATFAVYEAVLGRLPGD